MQTKSIRALITTVLMLMPTLAVNCAKHSTVIVAPGYERRDAINANVAVVILDRAPKFDYRGDPMKSLREINTKNETNSYYLMRDYFKTRIAADIVREVDVTGAFFAEPKDRYLVYREAVKTTEEDITVEIPDGAAPIGFDSTEAALVLFLDHVRAGTETDPYYADRAQHGLYTTAARKLIFLASFVLWDNRELKPICYGRVKSWMPISREEATIGNWEDVSRDFVRQVFYETGFLRPKEK